MAHRWNQLVHCASILAALIAVCGPARALELGLPLACAVDRDCWISNHVDGDPGPGARDYRCGSFTYDGHNGVDLALRDLEAMAAGVTVVAAADGIVRATRDALPDRSIKEGGQGLVRGRECGNGVVLVHEGGWETQYCHMRRGSIAVAQDQAIKRGQALGLVGLSGETEYPHLHFSVRQGGRAVDPFLGPEGKPCGETRAPLWTEAVLAQLRYAPGTVFNYGLVDRKPEAEAAGRGEYRAVSLAREGEAVVLWMQAFGVRPNDRLHLRVTGPDGATLATNEEVIAKAQARIFRFIGQKRRDAAWKPGVYRGEIRYEPFDDLPAQTIVTTAQID